MTKGFNKVSKWILQCYFQSIIVQCFYACKSISRACLTFIIPYYWSCMICQIRCSICQCKPCPCICKVSCYNFSAAMELDTFFQVEGIYQTIITYIPFFCHSWHCFQCFRIILNKTIKNLSCNLDTFTFITICRV